MSILQESSTQAEEDRSGYSLREGPDRPERSLQGIAKEIAGHLKIDRVSIWRFTCALDEMRLIQVFDREVDDPETGQVLKVQNYPAFLGAVLEGRIFYTKDVKMVPQFSELLIDYWLFHDVRSALVIPLILESGIRAVVILENSRTQRRWLAADVSRAASVVEAIVQPLERYELFRTSELLGAIQDVQTYFSLGAELPSGLQCIIKSGCKLIQASAGLAYRVETNPETLRCIAGYGTRNDWIGHTQLEEKGPLGFAIENGQPVVLTETSLWEGGEELYEAEEISSLVCQPILLQGQATGAILFIFREEDRPPGGDILEIIEPLAAQAAMPIQMDRYLEEIRRKESYQAALKEIGEVSQAASGLSDLLNSSIDKVCLALRASIGIAWLDGQAWTKGYTTRAGQAFAELIRESGLDLTGTQAVRDWERPPVGTAVIAVDIARFGLRSSLILPIRSSDDERGMLIFGMAGAHTWGEDEIAMVETAAELISAAIERIESARAVQSQRDLLCVLETTSTKLGHVRGFQNILSILGEGAMTLAKTYRAAVIIKQRDGRVTIPWMSGLPRSYAEGVTGQQPSSLICLFEIPAPVMITQRTNSSREAVLGSVLQVDAFAAIGLWPLSYDGQHNALMACYYDEIPHLRAFNEVILQIFLRQGAAVLENAGLYERLENQYIQTALTLAMAVEDSEADPSERSQRMAELARETARRMGVSDRGLEAIYWAALLHDIGKSAVPKEVLRKSEPLNAQEWEILHQVPLDGERYLGGIDHFRGAARLVRHFREHYDGGGYPDQLRGDQIPLGARILAVADAFQAMTEKRPYRKPLSPQEALAELHRLAGRQFDPRVVTMFDDWVRNETGEERLN